MKKNLLFIFVILLLGSASVLHAVPAIPHPIVMTQPNGDTLTVRIKGDERINWYESMDGYTLLFNHAGYLSYAQLDVNGDLQPSEIIATAIEHRNSTVQSFLNTIEKRLFFSDLQTQLRLQVWQIEENAQTRNTREVIGQYKTICAFVQFPEKAMTIPMSRFESLMNQLGYTTTGSGSVRDFFRESSYNQFDLIITLTGVYTAPNSESYYAGSNGTANCQSLARWLAQQVAAEPDINFADYDSDNDGVVDGFHFVFAGRGQEDGAGPGTIWSHKWEFSPAVTQNGKSISIYSCSPEYLFDNISTIGVICHEMTHAFGAMDFYDTNYETGGQYEGTGEWDIMAGGSWNNNGNRPAHHNPYVKTQFGWLNPIVLNEPVTIANMPNTTESPIAFRINTTTPNEYFILENRQQVKFDSGIPGEGMIIYRVHSQIEAAFYMNVINATHPQRMYPVSANAPVALPVANPTSYGEINSYDTPWGNDKTQFTDNSIPAMVSWANAPTNKPITNITHTNGMISFNFMGGGTSGTHIIVASAGVNGTISPSGIVTVTHGASQTFTFSANTGYEIEKVLIDGVAIPDFSTGTYTFTNVTGNHAIYVSCVKPLDFFCGGDGTENNPWQICDLTSFLAFRDYTNSNGAATAGKYYILTEDIDLTDVGDWIPISIAYNPFLGNFNGNHKVVKNLYMSGSGTNRGLFSWVSFATIKNLGVENCNVSGGRCTGALVGSFVNGSVIENCYSTGTVTGIDGDLLAAHEIGGLVGSSYGSSIKNSYSTCNVTGTAHVGGLAGFFSGYGQVVANCYATGNVTGSYNIGGLIGYLWNGGTLQNSVAANEAISAGAGYADAVNRIVGKEEYGAYHNNYALSTMVVKAGSVVLTKTDDNSVNGTGKPKTTLQSYSFYSTGSNWYNNTAWNITNTTGIWKICDGASYPFFRWQDLECPFVAVTNITGVPTVAMATIPCTLTGTVVPNNATNQIIIWSVQSAGTTGATISPTGGGVWNLNTTGIGTAVVTATIENGLSETTPYTQNFIITVNKATQTAPPAPTLSSATTTSITLNTVAGCEYSRNGGAYQSSPLFSELTTNTSYSFTQRKAETATHSASPASVAASFSTVGIPPVKNLLVTNFQNCVASLSWSAPDAGPGYEGCDNNYMIKAYIVDATGQSIVLGDDHSRSPLSYDIYCNDNKIGNTTSLSYSHTITETNNYNFCVVAIYEGGEESAAVCKNVTISCEDFVPVTNITGVPTTATVTVPCTLTGTVVPANATNKTITWSVQNAGTTGATISPAGGGGGWNLNTTGIGTVVVTATIENGASETSNFTKNFTITVNKATQTAPGAPTLSSSTTTSITLNTMTGCQYRRDGDTWQTSSLFSDLTPNTTYRFEAYKPETATHLASPVSPSASFTTQPLGIADDEFADVVVYSYLNVVYINIVETRHALFLQTVEIFDITGRIIHRFTITEMETAIPLHVASGIYTVKLISQEQKMAVRKVMIQR